MRYYNSLNKTEAIKRFESINKNKNNRYHSGYEWMLDFVPVIKKIDDDYEQKRNEAASALLDLAPMLLNDTYVLNSWPKRGTNDRIVLAIDETTSAEILLVRWNIATPIHGHDAGQMIDILIAGSARETDYELIDAEARIVKQIKEEDFHSSNGPIVLLNGFFEQGNAQLDAFIHKTTPIINAITLHLVPAHPRDGIGNTFIEQP